MSNKGEEIFDGETMIISDDGGWCWFQSPIAIQHDSLILIGSVASGRHDRMRKGNIELHIFNHRTKSIDHVVLHENFELDDHDTPALFLRPDHRLLLIYAKHGTESCNYSRLSVHNDPSYRHFEPVQIFHPSPTTELTYANLFVLPKENHRLYNFFRGLDGSYKPSYLYSDDLGITWSTGNIVINVPATEKHRPYVRYISNEEDTIHLIYTEGHPRDYDNNLYHIYYKKSHLYQSNGTLIGSLREGLDRPDQGTLIYRGDADQVPWIVDLVLNHQQYPICLFSVQYNSAGLPVGQGGDDLRYRYARWDGSKWNDFFLAHAGSRLYSGEDDYSGLAAIEPDDPSIVYISTNSHPTTGEPLISEQDQRRHYEIFRGHTNDHGESWTWIPLTINSTVDNLRPMRPRDVYHRSSYRALLWLRGTYSAYTDYSQEIVARIWTTREANTE